jgi:hypothetical protein
MKRLGLLLLVLPVLVFSSCSKDDTPPVITITSPAEGSTLLKGQTYPVQGTITDDEELSQVNIGGVNVTTFDSKTKWTIANVTLPISASETSSFGSFTVTATDKEGNTATKTVSFKIQ